MKIFILVLLVCLSFCVKIEEGTLEVQIKSPAVSGSDKFRVNIDSQIRS